MTARALLINPWIYDFAAFNLWGAPLGLLYIASVLREAGYEIDYVDCLDPHFPGLAEYMGPHLPRVEPYGYGKYVRTVVDKPAILRHIPRYFARYGLPLELFDRRLESLPTPDVILVTSGMTYWYLGPFEAIRRAKARFPGVPVILGGIYATLCYEHAVAKSGADVVVRGPGEEAALRLVGEITGHGSATHAFESLDDLPYPAYDLRHHPDFVVITTSRGCPLRCTYCASHLMNPAGFRRRSPLGVVDEIEHWHVRYGVPDIAFFDDALLIDAENHLNVILREVMRRGLHPRFHTPNGLHARLLDAGLAELLKASGFCTVRLSLETVNMDRQRDIGPKVTAPELAHAVSHLKEAGFAGSQVGVYLLMGLPGQPLQEVIDSVHFVHDLGVRAYVSLYTPIPGTEEWAHAVRAGVIQPGMDPLLQNNTIYPAMGGVSPEACQQVMDLAREGNRRIS